MVLQKKKKLHAFCKLGNTFLKLRVLVKIVNLLTFIIRNYDATCLTNAQPFRVDYTSMPSQKDYLAYEV